MALEQQSKSLLLSGLFPAVVSGGLLGVVAGALLALGSYGVLLGIYRLTLHPLAKFPGPKLAGLTYWYEFYQDVVKPGQYIFKIKELHQVYGPVLRVNPNEVHIADPEFFTEIYHSRATKTHRDTYHNLDYLGQSIAFTTDHDVHTWRRASLTNYFSTKSLRALEDRIQDVVATMCDRLHGVKVAATVIDLRSVYAAMALDIIAEYSFGKSGSTAFMSNPEFGKFWVDVGETQVPMNPLARQFGWMFRVMTSMPESMMRKLMPQMTAYFNWEDLLYSRIKQLSKQEADEKSNADENEITLLHELVTNPHLPASDKTPRRLKEEAQLLLGAGGETTSSTLARTTYYLLANPDALQKLKRELQEAFPDPKQIPSLDQVSHLPYLNAVVEEGLRITNPVPDRAPRVFEDHPLVYRDWTIPPGVAISQSPYFTQTDPHLFPDPREFRPERWLNNPGLLKYQVAFSKGRRMCLGINLAYFELRLGLAAVFRRFDLELFETGREDVDMAFDFFISHPVKGTKGIRVRVVGEAGS